MDPYSHKLEQQHEIITEMDEFSVSAWLRLVDFSQIFNSVLFAKINTGL